MRRRLGCGRSKARRERSFGKPIHCHRRLPVGLSHSPRGHTPLGSYPLSSPRSLSPTTSTTSEPCGHCCARHLTPIHCFAFNRFRCGYHSESQPDCRGMDGLVAIKFTPIVIAGRNFWVWRAGNWDSGTILLSTRMLKPIRNQE